MNSNDLARGFERIMADQRGYYLIGYQPEAGTLHSRATRKFRKVKIKVKLKGLKVRTRVGLLRAGDGVAWGCKGVGVVGKSGGGAFSFRAPWGAVSADPVGGRELAADAQPAVGDVGTAADLDGAVRLSTSSTPIATAS